MSLDVIILLFLLFCFLPASKYKKEGKPLPTDQELENDSKQTANRAHDIIAKRGKNIWEELKKVYSRDKNKGKGSQG